MKPAKEQGWDGDRALFCHPARDITAAVTKDMGKLEREIDERVAGLYGVGLEDIGQSIRKGAIMTVSGSDVPEDPWSKAQECSDRFSQFAKRVEALHRIGNIGLMISSKHVECCPGQPFTFPQIGDDPETGCPRGPGVLQYDELKKYNSGAWGTLPQALFFVLMAGFMDTLGELIRHRRAVNRILCSPSPRTPLNLPCLVCASGSLNEFDRCVQKLHKAGVDAAAFDNEDIGLISKWKCWRDTIGHGLDGMVREDYKKGPGRFGLQVGECVNVSHEDIEAAVCLLPSFGNKVVQHFPPKK